MELLKGKAVADAICLKAQSKVTESGVAPCLAVVRFGDKQEDLAYEGAIRKRFAGLGGCVVSYALPIDVSQQQAEELLCTLSQDHSVHGILLFRPLPSSIDEDAIKAVLNPRKDVDGMTYLSQALLYNNKPCFAPCTARAVIELLDYYGIALSGKNVTVIGRSAVIGRPLALMLLNRNATVTVCHTRTVDLPSITRNADVIVACAGSAAMVTREFVSQGQTVIDVGVNVLNGKLCGDVDFDAVSQAVERITPVPGGVGAVTTAVLFQQTLTAALTK